jgi:hypothetical protein
MSKHKPTCQDCYFHRNALCALVSEQTCPTFRAAEKVLAPPPQPRLVPRPLGAGTPLPAYT